MAFQRAQERFQQSIIHEFTVPNVQQLFSHDLAQNPLNPWSSFDTPCTEGDIYGILKKWALYICLPVKEVCFPVRLAHIFAPFGGFLVECPNIEHT